MIPFIWNTYDEQITEIESRLKITRSLEEEIMKSYCLMGNLLGVMKNVLKIVEMFLQLLKMPLNCTLKNG